MNRVCIDFKGTTSITANTTTTLINLPAAIRPKTNKNFVVVGQTTDSIHVGYGEITTDGAIQVTFANNISSYTRFSVVYDLD